MLEQSDIAHYLLSLGLVKPRDVVEEGLTVVDASRRNCVYLAATGGGPTYVVKQATPRTARTLLHEAAVVAVLAAAPELSAQVPKLLHVDPEAARLVFRTPAGALDWNQNHSAGGFPRTWGRVLGRALASLHRLPANSVEDRPPGVDPMWGLSLPEPPHELLLNLSSGAQDLVARLQASRSFCERLEGLRDGNLDGAVVHGDLRWDNCLAIAPSGSRRRTCLLLVDWELAGPGPAEFDIGTVLAEYLCSWVSSIPMVEPRDPGRHVSEARYPLRRMQPAIQAFWSAYRLASAQCPTLRRVIELAAVGVLQRAVERAHGLPSASAQVVTLLQLADNMLRAPNDAALSLLGLRE